MSRDGVTLKDGTQVSEDMWAEPEDACQKSPDGVYKLLFSDSYLSLFFPPLFAPPVPLRRFAMSSELDFVITLGNDM